MAFLPDGSKLAIANANKSVSLLEFDTKVEQTRIEVDAPLLSLDISPEGDLLALPEQRSRLKIWSRTAKKTVMGLGDGNASFNCVAFSPDGQMIAAGWGAGIGGKWQRRISVWNRDTQEKIAELDAGSGAINAVEFSPDGNTLVAATSARWGPTGNVERNGLVARWDTKTWEQTGSQSWTYQVYCLAFSPDGRTLVAGGGSWFNVNRGGSIRVWDLKNGQETTLKGHVGLVTSVGFSPEGKTLAAATESGQVAIWDVDTWQQRLDLQWEDHHIDCLVFSPDGKTMVTGSAGGDVKFWCAGTDNDVAQHFVEVTGVAHEMAQARPHEAADIYEQALSLSERLFIDEASKEDLAALWNVRGVALFRQDELERAAADFTKAIQRSPKNVQYRTNRATTYGRLQEWTKAMEDYNQAVELEPEDWSILRSRAIALVKQGKYGKAVADFSKVVSLNPDEPRHWYEKALLELADDHADRYRQSCQQMLKRFRATDDPETAYWVAWTCALAPDVIDKMATVERLVRQVQDNAPGDSGYKHSLGAILYRVGRLEEAVEKLQAVAESRKAASNKLSSFSPAYVWWFLAMAQHRLGDSEAERRLLNRAEQWYEKVFTTVDNGLQEDTAIPWNRHLTAKLLRQEAESLDARDRERLAKLEAAVEADPQQVQDWQALARFYANRGCWGKAAEAWSKVIDLRPDAPGIWLQRGYTIAYGDDWQRARDDFARAIALSDGSQQLAIEVSEFCLVRGHRDLAVEIYTKAIEENPDDELRVRRAQLHPDVVAAWNFDQGTEGWIALKDCELTASDGVLEVTSTGQDPYMNVDASAPPGPKELLLRAKFTGKRTFQLFWNSSDHAGYEARRSTRTELWAPDDRWHKYQFYFDVDSELASLRLDPDDQSGTRMEIASITLANTTPERALMSLGKAIELNPDDPLPLVQRAELLAVEGETDAAIADLTKAIALWPENNNLFVRRAKLYASLKEWKAVLADAIQALEKDANDKEEMLRLRSMALRHLGRWEEAITTSTQLIEMDNQNVWWRYHRGECYEKLGQLAKAIADFRGSLEADQEQTWSHRHLALEKLAVCHAMRGEWEEAAKYSSDVFSEHGDSVRAHPWYTRNQALLQLMVGNQRDYVDACQAMLHIRRDTKNAQEAMWAVQLCTLAPDALSAEGYEQLRELAARSSDPECCKASVLLRMGQFEQSAKLFAKAPGGGHDCVLKRAIAEFRSGNKEAADAMLAKSLKYMHDNPFQAVKGKETDGPDWNYWIRITVLAREAKQIIRGSSDTMNDSASR